MCAWDFVCVHVHTHTWRLEDSLNTLSYRPLFKNSFYFVYVNSMGRGPWRPEVSIAFLGARFAGDWKPPTVGSKDLKPLSFLSGLGLDF